MVSEMKLKALITYLCWTTIKPVCIYFLIVYGVVTIGNFCSYAITGSLDATVFNGVEFSSCIYLGVTGALGYKEDFKMAIQNGFIRKYIGLAAIMMFLFVACLMGLVDTIGANIMESVLPNYNSLIISLYGNINYVTQWLLLTLLYVTVAISSYLVVTISNKVGAKKFYLVAIALLLVIFVITPVLVPTFWQNNADFMIKAMGFGAADGVNILYPISFFLAIIVLLASGSSLMIKRTELK